MNHKAIQTKRSDLNEKKRIKLRRKENTINKFWSFVEDEYSCFSELRSNTGSQIGLFFKEGTGFYFKLAWRARHKLTSHTRQHVNELKSFGESLIRQSEHGGLFITGNDCGEVSCHSTPFSWLYPHLFWYRRLCYYLFFSWLSMFWNLDRYLGKLCVSYVLYVSRHN